MLVRSSGASWQTHRDPHNRPGRRVHLCDLGDNHSDRTHLDQFHGGSHDYASHDHDDRDDGAH